MERLVNCDFSGMHFLWGWTRPHTEISSLSSGDLPRVSAEFSPRLAADACSSSDLVVYKTVAEYGRRFDDVATFLDAQPHVRSLMPVRDPRAIFASVKELPWNASLKSMDTLKAICEDRASFIGRSHERLHHIVFEDLLEKP